MLKDTKLFAGLPAGLRRHTLNAAVCMASLSALLGAGAAQAFSLDDVTNRARTLVEKPYQKPASNLPPVFSSMQFGDYIKIQPRRDQFAWNDVDTPFKLGFYHQGMHFNVPVKINEVVGDQVREMKYQPERFDFGGLNFDRESTSKLGYAGFRVMYPINKENQLDEIMSVLGASYFRVIGKDQIYGLSGRGLAIDTGLSKPEEFPDFREFWIERPKPEDRHVVIYALMDSPRATGAYRFVLRPGADAVLDVQSRVFMRDTVTRFGIAPLTSMFLYGPSQRTHHHNFRPALHDSNGLAIRTGQGEWLWRPLNNPPFNVALSSFQVDNPRGFGLLQRGHEFWRYEDLKDRYDLRPSAWIEPQGDWGRGTVELIEIPTPDETNDNIVAFWSPEKMPVKGQAMQFDYRIHWTLNEPAFMGNTAWVKQTLRSAGEITQANLIRKLDGTTGLAVDFEGPVLQQLPAGTQVAAQVSVDDNAEVIENVLVPNGPIKGWRLNLRVKVKDPTRPVEMRANLVENGRVLSETWSFQLPPSEKAGS